MLQRKNCEKCQKCRKCDFPCFFYTEIILSAFSQLFMILFFAESLSLQLDLFMRTDIPFTVCDPILLFQIAGNII